MMTKKPKPTWGNDDDVVISYVRKIDFFESSFCMKLYPTIEALKAVYQDDDVDIVKVAVKEIGNLDKLPEEDAIKNRNGWMEYIEFYYELGGAKAGNEVHSTKFELTETRPYAKKYGVVNVLVTLVEETEEYEDFFKELEMLEGDPAGLTDEMKRFIINYSLTDFSKGIIEDVDSPLSAAYEDGSISGEDINDFIDKCREKLLDEI